MFMAVQEANSVVLCSCGGHKPMKLTRTAGDWLTTRRMVTNAKGERRKHPDLCFNCLEPCKVGSVCSCTNPAKRINPYYRLPGTNYLMRNNELSIEMLEGFFAKLESELCLPDRQGRTEIDCLCGAVVVRADACFHVQCSNCGFNLCTRCNFATYMEKDSVNTLVDHYGPAYLGLCSQFPVSTQLFWNGLPLSMKYPCKEVSSSKLRSGKSGGCRSPEHDCCNPTHHVWQEMFANNRKARQAIRCVNALRGTLLFVLGRKALLKYELLMSFGQKSSLY